MFNTWLSFLKTLPTYFQYCLIKYGQRKKNELQFYCHWDCKFKSPALNFLNSLNLCKNVIQTWKFIPTINSNPFCKWQSLQFFFDLLLIFLLVKHKCYVSMKESNEIIPNTSSKQCSIRKQGPFLVTWYFHCISLTLFFVGLTNSYSNITNKYQHKQKIKNQHRF